MFYTQKPVHCSDLTTGTHNWAIGREWETLEHSILGDRSLSKPSHPGWKESMLKRKQRHCKSQRWWMTQGNCLPEMTGQMCIWAQRDCDSIHTMCAGINWTKISALRRGSGHKVTLLSQKLLQLTLPGKGKIISFLQQSVIEWINHILVQALFTGPVGQHEADSVVFEGLWWHVLLVLFIFF